MERWRIAECRSKSSKKYYLANRSRTVVKISARAKNFDVQSFLKELQKIKFPIRFTNNIQTITFSILGKRTFGLYCDDEIWIDVRKKHRMKTLVETFVHEVAHHVDLSGAHNSLDPKLKHERKMKGKYIHTIARQSDDEYFARGFERFYAINPKYKKRLRQRNPRLYRAIEQLHRKYRQK